MKSVIIIATFFFIAGISTAQTTWYVPDDFPTIQRALSDPTVVDGVTIIVKPGLELL